MENVRFIDIMVVTAILSCILSLLIGKITMQCVTSKGQNYFALLTGAMFFYSICVLIENLAWNKNAVINAVKIGYVAKLFVFIFFIYFVAEYYHINFRNKLVKFSLWGYNCFIWFTIICIPKSNLFFRVYEVKKDFRLIVQVKQYGLSYYMMEVETYLILFIGFVLVVSKMLSQNNRQHFRRNLCVFAGVFISYISILTQWIKGLQEFNLFPFGFSIASCFFLIGIKKFHMFDLEQNAKEYVLDNAYEGILILNEYKKVIYYNNVFKKMCSEVEINRLYSEVITKEKIGESAYQKYVDLFDIETEIVETSESKVKNKKIEFLLNEHYYQLYRTPLFRKDNSIYGFLIEIDDMTQKNKDIGELEKLTSEANKANRAKSEFLANMSHEIRTPINAILGMDEIILREAKESNVLEYANSVMVAGNSLLGLVNNILDFSKLESGKMDVIPVEYEIEDIIKSVYKQIFNKKSKNIIKDMSFKIDENIPRLLFGDVVRLEQLLINIILCASKYAKLEKIKVNITSKKVRGNYEKCPRLEIIIEIVQIGDNIHDKEYETLRKNQNGAITDQIDISLGITRLLVDMLGGTFTIDEKEDTNLLTYIIPQGIVDETPVGYIDISEIESRQTVPKKQLVIEGVKLLVVDDNAVNLKVMKGLLKRTKADVHLAKSGKECLEKVKEEEYAIIFMDHVMPEMDGIETLKNLKSMPDNLSINTPVIALTANALPGSREMYLKAGFNNYLMKPVEVETMENVIKKYVQTE